MQADLMNSCIGGGKHSYVYAFGFKPVKRFDNVYSIRQGNSRNSWSFFGGHDLLVICMFYVFLKTFRLITEIYFLLIYCTGNIEQIQNGHLLSCNVILSDL